MAHGSLDRPIPYIGPGNRSVLQESPLRLAMCYRNSLQYDLSLANQKIAQIEGEISKLPENKQEWLKLSRKYNLSDNIYNTFLQKRSEASIVKAANLSDIQFLKKKII